MASNYIKNVAIVGATGTIGKFLTAALVKTGKHNVTAITRADSKSEIPVGVTAKHVDYDDHSSLVDGLEGQDMLIITMAVLAPKDTQQKLITAAKEAGVGWIMPNEWGYSFDDPDDQFGKETMLGPRIADTRKLIKDLGLNFIGVNSGFWFQFSLGGGADRYGFDMKNRSVTMFDDGETKIETTTWPQTGRAVAEVLSLPISPKDSNDKGLTVSKWRNGTIYIQSFKLSQQDMLASLLRVTGTTRADWKISSEDAHERWTKASEKLQVGDMSTYVTKMYTRAFFKDGKSDYSAKVQNDILHLPKEDLDTCVKEAVEYAKDAKYAI